MSAFYEKTYLAAPLKKGVKSLLVFKSQFQLNLTCIILKPANIFIFIDLYANQEAIAVNRNKKLTVAKFQFYVFGIDVGFRLNLFSKA